MSAVYDELRVTCCQEPEAGLRLPATLTERIVDDEAGQRVQATETSRRVVFGAEKETPNRRSCRLPAGGQARQFGDLARRLGREAQEAPERLQVRIDRWGVFEVERRNEVAPAEQFPPPRSPQRQPHGQVDQLQYALVAGPGPVPRPEFHVCEAAVHLIADHEDLLHERKRRPSFR